MSRKVQNATSMLDSRTARDKLKARPKPYYVALIPGELHLGYRRRRKGKGQQGGWLTRKYLGRAITELAGTANRTLVLPTTTSMPMVRGYSVTLRHMTSRWGEGLGTSSLMVR